MYDFAVIGAGIHGTTMLRRLADRGAKNMVVIDPNKPNQYTAQWDQFTGNTLGMEVLRSPMPRFIDDGQNALELLDYGKRHSNMGRELGYIAPEALRRGNVTPADIRPSRWLFNHHVQTVVIPKLKQAVQWVQGQTKQITYNPRTQQFNIYTSDSRRPIAAKHVIIATGQADTPNIPNWANALQKSKALNDRWRVEHIFDPAFNTQRFVKNTLPNQPIVIVGGGISALQLASALALKHSRNVTLITRQPITAQSVQALDFAPEAGKPESPLLQRFHRMRPEAKAKLIQQHRYPGSYPKDVFDEFQRALQSQRLNVMVGEVQSASDDRQNVHLTVLCPITHKPGRSIEIQKQMKAPYVLLATGFPKSPFKKDAGLLGQLAREMNLPIAEGLPNVDRSLQWGHHPLFVMGAPGELGIGPANRTIAGAQLGASQILEHSDVQQTLAPWWKKIF